MRLHGGLYGSNILYYGTVAIRLSQSTGDELLHYRFVNLRRIGLMHSVGFWRVALGFYDKSIVGFHVVLLACV